MKHPKARIVPPSDDGVAVHNLARWCGGQVYVENIPELGWTRIIRIPTPRGEVEAWHGNVILKDPDGYIRVLDLDMTQEKSMQ